MGRPYRKSPRADCFISYASPDADLARYVALEARARDLRPFVALFSIPAGQEWTSAIVQALRAARWVFVLASRS